MEKKMVVQRIVNRADSSIQRAVKYYSILDTLNSLKLTEKHIQLMAFIATRGSISSGGAKETFKELFGSSKASIGNFVWELTQKGILTRKDGRVVLHPQLALDFSNDVIVLNITMTHG